MILLKTLNMTPAEIRKAVIAMDEFLLPRHVLDQLLKFVPTDEEVCRWRTFGGGAAWLPGSHATSPMACFWCPHAQIALIKEHENELEKLGLADRFFYEVRRQPPTRMRGDHVVRVPDHGQMCPRWRS